MDKELYGDITALKIFQNMLDRYKYEFDKREGSIVWDEFMNVAIEMRHLYIQLDWQWKQMFGDTADRDALIRLAADRDIYPLPANNAIVRGVFNIPIDKGERFNAGDINFVVTEQITDMETDDGFFRYKMMCEEIGEVGNVSNWDITPIKNIEGLTYARIEAILVPGEDEEDTESFRERYYESLRHNKYGFNIAEYQYQVNMIPGVGACRVYPADPEPGHVRIVILDSKFMPASTELIKSVQEILDPVPYHQQGIGRAPIGHFVNVETAKPVEVNVLCKPILESGMVFKDIQADAFDVVSKYIAEVRESFQKEFDSINRDKGLVVRQAHVETRILDIKGVLDIEKCLLNGVDGNLVLDKDSIPVVGVVNYVQD